MIIDSRRLRGRRIAALITDGFEQVELIEPVAALKHAGAEVEIVAPGGNTVRAWDHTDWGGSVRAGADSDLVDSHDYDGLLLPGGVMSPDKLRMDPGALNFVRGFANAGKPIAAICHGPWTLINAGVVRGRQVTSYPSLQLDLEHAGARWVDCEVVVDGNLVTSRRPDDLPAFNEAIVELFAGDAAEDGQPSTAPNASFDAVARAGAVGDADVLAGNTLGNKAYPEGNTYPQASDARNPRRDH